MAFWPCRHRVERALSLAKCLEPSREKSMCAQGSLDRGIVQRAEVWRSDVAGLRSVQIRLWKTDTQLDIRAFFQMLFLSIKNETWET